MLRGDEVVPSRSIRNDRLEDMKIDRLVQLVLEL